MTIKSSRFLVFLLAALPLVAQNRDSHNGHDVAANQVILKVRVPIAGVLQQLRQICDADDLRALNSLQGLYLLHSRSGTVAALLALLQANSSVAYVEPDYILKASNTPNDPYFPQQWSFLNTALPGADIGATFAWDLSTGSAATVMGVVDTGIDYTHPDLAANVWSAPSAFTVVLSWGQLTCPAGSHGYNAIARSCDPRDDNQHGTHVSGTIGAAGNNAGGVAGVNWTTRIMGLKFLSAAGSGTTSDAIDAMEFAMQAKSVFGAAANVRVLSNSWGGSGFSQALLDEINKANTSEMLFVAAAGNSSQNMDVAPQYPAAYNAPNIISVAATTSTDSLASFSNWGKTTVHLGAPGVNILSTLPGGAYGYLSGTSMATPHVSGAAMLLLSRCGLTTAGLKTVLLSNTDPIPALAGITVTGGRLNVNRAIHSCTGSTGSSGAATFLKTDTTTSGTWKGVYGGDGALIIGDASNVPAYATVTPFSNSTYTWATSTTDARAPQKIASTDRVAACWYSGSSFTVDLKFNDQNTHQVALYVLDFDSYNGPRAERIDIVDTSNNTLDSRSVSNFFGGQYLVWNLSGHVVMRITNTNPASNALITTLLFGAGSTPPPSGGSAAFLKTDTTTSGTWRGVYGADGANVIGDAASYPSYVAVTPAGNSAYTWFTSTTDPRAPQKLSSPADRIASCWYSYSAFTMDVKFSDQNTHQVALYLLDFDNFNGPRAERVDILDAATNAVLDTRSVSGFNSGQYLVWNLGGHVVIRVTNTNPSSNALVTGLFFGAGGAPAGNMATFLKSDTTTSGTWRGVYGSEGANVIGDTASYPSYVTVTPAGNSAYTWFTSTTDPRAPQKVSSPSDRIASCWYSYSAFTLDVVFSDTATHQVALYLLDFDNYNGPRAERVDVLDADTNAVLDTRSVSGFNNGQYLVWNLSGHVVFRVTSTNPISNALVNGIFFR
jgi:subtilisin family serine protease